MAGTFNFNVVAPDGQVFNKEVEFVVVPGVTGEIGILPNHAPLVAGLGIGVIRYKDEGVDKKIAISGGFMEVANNKVTVLAKTAEKAEDIDVERAKAAKERAEKRLQERKPETDVVRAQIALQRALVRLKAAE
ncbi:MAG: F0F1 ATP synthase subunit epsilon [Peptococcaceae bacterium]|jgi:F-type H+-transporting ATPase subunit epsilon|nr:F0F1 ATP synthase subunit epsilon [Peptococcaceae bacterium]